MGPGKWHRGSLRVPDMSGNQAGGLSTNKVMLGLLLVVDLAVGALFMGRPFTTGRVAIYIVTGLIAVVLIALLLRGNKVAK